MGRLREAVAQLGSLDLSEAEAADAVLHAREKLRDSREALTRLPELKRLANKLNASGWASHLMRPDRAVYEVVASANYGCSLDDVIALSGGGRGGGSGGGGGSSSNWQAAQEAAMEACPPTRAGCGRHWRRLRHCDAPRSAILAPRAPMERRCAH